VAATAPLDERAVSAWLHIRDCEGQEPSYREVGRALGTHHATVAKAVRDHLADAPQAPAAAVHDASPPAGAPLRPAESPNGRAHV
jgi:hypothetical protein